MGTGMASLPTCIIADDHAVMRDVIRMRLEAGALVEVVGEAADGVEALDLIRSVRPRLALVDLRMPAASGIDVARSVDAEGLATRVVIVSARIDEGMVASAREAGAHGYVAKDATHATFMSVLESALRGDGFAVAGA